MEDLPLSLAVTNIYQSFIFSNLGVIFTKVILFSTLTLLYMKKWV